MLPFRIPLPPRSAGEMRGGELAARLPKGLVIGSMKAAVAGLRRDGDDAIAAERATNGSSMTILLQQLFRIPLLATNGILCQLRNGYNAFSVQCSCGW